MQNRLWTFLIFALVSYSAVDAQKGLSSDFQNYIIVDTGIIKRVIPKINDGSIQIVYYPDSILSADYFEPKYVKSKINWTSDGLIDGAYSGSYDTLILSNPWAHDLKRNDLRIISLINISNEEQKICFVHGPPYYILYPAIIKQAKNEAGIWQDIESLNKSKSNYGLYSEYLKANYYITVIVKTEIGDYETEIRFKLLVNRPPDYPTEKYIYSKPFRSKINKSLLTK